MTLFHKITRYLAQIGSLLWNGHFFRLTQKILSHLFSSKGFAMKKTMLYRLTDPVFFQPKENSEAIEVFAGDRESISDMVRDLYDNDPKTLEFYLDFLRQGFEPWLARHEKRIVGVVWLFSGSYLAPWEGYDGYVLNFVVDSTEKFVGNVFVSNSMRGQGLFPKIANEILNVYPQMLFYSCIDEANTSSRRSHEKVGFKVYASVYYFRFWQYTHCLLLSEKYRVSFFRVKRGKPVDVSLVPRFPLDKKNQAQ